MIILDLLEDHPKDKEINNKNKEKDFREINHLSRILLEDQDLLNQRWLDWIVKGRNFKEKGNKLNLDKIKEINIGINKKELLIHQLEGNK